MTERGPGRLAGRACVVGGGTSGIGEAVALQLAAEGGRVAVLGRRREQGTAVAARLNEHGGGGEARHAFFECEVRNADSCAAAVAAAAAFLGGRVDVLVCAAGIVLAGTAETTTEAEWGATFDTNVAGTWRLCREALPLMRQQRSGVIVTVASDWACVGARNAIAYCASKGAVVQLTRCVALDYAADGVRANALCPGDTFVSRWGESGYYSNSLAATGVSRTEADADARLSSVPLGRVADESEIARAAVFLASDDSSFMTGQTLVVDGGNTAR